MPPRRVKRNSEKTSDEYKTKDQQNPDTEDDSRRQCQAAIGKTRQGHDNDLEDEQVQNTRLHDMRKEREKLQGESEKILQEYQSFKQLAHNVNQQLQESNAEIQSLKQNLQDATEERNKLQQENQHIINENQALRQRLQGSNNTVQRLREEIERKIGNIDQLQRQLNEVRESEENEKKQKDEALTRIQDITRDREKLQRENKQIIKEYQDLQQFANNVNRQFQDSIAEVHSVIAGDNLRSKNPNITDSSYLNRPMKIAEMFAELFDNDWTDAMETLENHGLEEKECIGILLHFLTDAYEECGRRVTELDSFIQHAVLLSAPDSQADESGDSGQELPAEITKPIKDLRKKLTDNNIEVLQKILPQHLKEKRNLTEDQIKDCKDFIKDCIKYAWMMQIQDPPVYIEWEFPEETEIDRNILKSYTKAGEKVDYIVWPVLYLHKNGPILSKGVVQPISTKRQ